MVASCLGWFIEQTGPDVRIAKIRSVASLGLALLLPGCAIHPEPFSDIEISLAAEQGAAEVDAGQEGIVRAIGLHEAMARALKYNLDFRVEAMQQSLRVAELDLSHWNLLPNAVAKAGYANRDNYSASFSTRVLPGDVLDPSPVPEVRNSTSQEKHINTADIGFSWNVLDFGLSYVRARQAADKVLIAEEMKRKVIQRIVEDVRTAYWRAVSAERLMRRLGQLEHRTQQALASTRELYNNRDTSPITALTYERELVEIKRSIQELERDLKVAKSQLAALMNLKPGTQFALVVPPRSSKSPGLTMGLGEMVDVALRFRSELREVGYQRRINSHEADAALLELLPGFQMYAGSNYDSNSFLMNAAWFDWGYKASWNLLKVFQYPAKRDVVTLQDDVLKERQLALTMAIMTQVHVSRVRYLHLRKELATADEYLDVQRRLLSQMRTEAAADRISEQTLIREEMNTLVAEVKHDIAFAAVQTAYANLFSSMGLDPYAEELAQHMSVSEVASGLRARNLERGDASAKVTAASYGK